MNIGQLLGGAGVVGSQWRAAEESERVARTNQLKLEEQNRLDQLRKEMTQAPMPTPAPLPRFPGPDAGVLPVRYIETPYPAAPAAPEIGRAHV